MIAGLMIFIVLLTSTFLGGLLTPFDMTALKLFGGSVWISDVALAGVLLISVALGNRRGIFSHQLSKLLLVLVAFHLAQAGRNAFGGYDPKLVVNGFRGVAFYWLFFVALFLVRRPKDLNWVLGAIYIYSLYAACLAIPCALNWIQLEGMLTLTVNSGDTTAYGTALRIYPPSEYVFDFTLYLLAASLAFRTGKLRWAPTQIAVMGLVMASIVVTYSRTTIMTSLIALLIISGRRLLSWQGMLLGITLLVFGLVMNVVLVQNTGIGLESLWLRSSESVAEMQTRTGNFQGRVEILMEKVAATWDTYPVIGRGFDFGDAAAYVSREQNPFSRSAHNGFASVFVEGGILGSLLFLFVLFVVLREGFRVLRLRDPRYHPVTLAIVLFTLMMLLKAMTTDPFTDQVGSGVLALSWALLVRIREWSAVPEVVPTGRGPVPAPRRLQPAH